MRDDLWWIMDEEAMDVIENLPEDEEFWFVVLFDGEDTYSPTSRIEDAPDNWRLN